jgi:UDP-N-acetylglucosamine 2-epimerase (non-hydrolysing)
MPYTERSKENLVREGISRERIYVTGNPIHEVLTHHDSSIEKNSVLDDMGLEKGKYFVATLHRAENVDVESRLLAFIKSFSMIFDKYKMPIVWSVHPRTCSRLTKEMNTEINGVRLVPPLGLFEFIKLEKNAACVLTDSGTVQEECCIFKVPNVTLRDTTERPETIEVGSNILSGASTESVLRGVDIVMNRTRQWEPPREYLVKDVSSTVQRIILGY